MYSFIDKDKKQVNIESDQYEDAIKMAEDFIKYGRRLNPSNFHKNRTAYWEDFKYQLEKLNNNRQTA